MTDLITVQNVALRRGGTEVITAANFTLGSGLWWLRGANGSGKSTLLRALAGVCAPWRGSIHIAGHNLVNDPVTARQALGYAPQSAELLGYLSVREFVQTVAALRATPFGPTLDQAERWIHAACAPQRIDTLSAGQRRKLCLCAALCGAPRVMFLDEPETGLDQDAAAEMREQLTTLANTGHAILVASHTNALFRDSSVQAGQLHIENGEVLAHAT